MVDLIVHGYRGFLLCSLYPGQFCIGREREMLSSQINVERGVKMKWMVENISRMISHFVEENPFSKIPHIATYVHIYLSWLSNCAPSRVSSS